MTSRKNPKIDQLSWSKIKDQLLELGVELRVVLTAKAKKEYNLLTEKGKRVNALVHATY